MANEGYDMFRIDADDFDESMDYLGGEAKYKGFVDNSLPGGSNYQEVVFNWDNAPVRHGGFDHFPDDNQIAHALTRDRVLADGTDTKHIDELQSDLHTAGSKYGYEGPKLTKQINEIDEQNLILRDKIKNDFLNFNEVKDKYKLSGSDPAGARFDDDLAMFAQDQFPDISNRNIAEIAQRYGDQVKENFFRSKGYAYISPKGADAVIPSEANDLLNELISSGIKLEKNTDQISQLQKAIPNYPFKDDYHVMVLKNMLLDAIEEGKPALSVSGSAPIKARYHEKYHEFYSMLYDKKIPSAMKKLANKYGGVFEAKGSLDVENTFGPSTSHYRLFIDLDLLDANIIRITPEMKEKILKEGIQSFGTGGIVESGIKNLDISKKQTTGIVGL